MSLRYFIPVLFSLTAAVHADTTINFIQGGGQNHTIAIHKGIVFTPAGQGQRILWDTNNERMVMVNDAQRQYFVIDNNSIEKFSGFMEMMQQQMMAQLKNMPEAQRKAIEERMGITDETPATPTITLKKLGKNRTVSGVKCEQTDLLSDGNKTGEICIAELDAAKMDAKDYATMKKMFDLSKNLAEKTSKMGGAPAGASLVKNMPSLNGVPMEFKDLSSGQTVTIAAINSGATLNPADFAPGPGYQQIDPLQLMQQQMMPR